ncbi:hypothetical protein K432DRAFT_293122, partial [Lepidopterella palustris CBS 459.81]
LTPSIFCNWYENTHIQKVAALSGVPSAVRYEAITSPPYPGFLSEDASWLAVYGMPDIEFQQSAEFKVMGRQSEPRMGLLEDVFKKARFDMKCYECVEVH